MQPYRSWERSTHQLDIVPKENTIDRKNIPHLSVQHADNPLDLTTQRQIIPIYVPGRIINRNQLYGSISEISTNTEIINQRPMINPMFMLAVRNEYERMLRWLPSARFLTEPRLRDLVPYDDFVDAVLRIYQYYGN